MLGYPGSQPALALAGVGCGLRPDFRMESLFPSVVVGNSLPAAPLVTYAAKSATCRLRVVTCAATLASVGGGGVLLVAGAAGAAAGAAAAGAGAAGAAGAGVCALTWMAPRVKTRPQTVHRRMGERRLIIS